jgi:hypothetical protein
MMGVIFSSCFKGNYPQLYSNIKKYTPNLSPNGKILVSSTNILDSYSFMNKGVEYKLGVNENNKILFISTKKNINGDLKVSMTYEELKKKKYLTIHEEKGWGYIVPLNGKWNAYLNNDVDSSKVVFFFQREADKKSKLK